MTKFFPILVIGAALCIACGSKEKSVEPTTTENDSVVVAQDTSDIIAEAEQATVKTTEECKAFLEDFYKKLDKDLLDYAFVKRNLTRRALQYLADNYEYDCEGGDCLATWLFLYEGGGDTGPLKKRTIQSIDENTYQVTSVYDNPDGDYKYTVQLGLVKDGDTYKIDTVKPI